MNCVFLRSRVRCFTNDILFIGTTFAILCDEILDDSSRSDVIANLQRHKFDIIYISNIQRRHFCANVSQLIDKNGESVLFMSTRAFSQFSRNDIFIFERHVKRIVSVKYDVIEYVGGSSIGSCIGAIF